MTPLEYLRAVLCKILDCNPNEEMKEAERVLDSTISILKDWVSRAPYLAKYNQKFAITLLDKAITVKKYVDTLYSWYVPPFKIKTYNITGKVERLVAKLPNFRYDRWLRLDIAYYGVDLETFMKIVVWDWTDTKKYILDKFDCDKYAIYFKARMALDFGINALGVVLDYSSGHAYNVVIFTDVDEPILFEPQNDKLIKVDERNLRYYKLEDYYLIL